MKKIRKSNSKIRSNIMSFVLFFATILLLFFTIYVNKHYSLKMISDSVTYNVSGSLKYSVCYYENKYYPDECIIEPEKMGFINSLVEKIKLKYKYNLNLSREAEYIEYNYNIAAETIVTEKNDDSRILYYSKEILHKETKKIENGSAAMIDKDIIIDFRKYNDFVTSLKRDYVLPINSELIITASIDIIGNHSQMDESIKNRRESQIIIPLAEQTVDIETNNDNFTHNNIVAKYGKTPLFSKDAILTLLTYLTDFIVIGIWVYKIILLNSLNKTFDGKIKKILKQYDRAIVKTKKLPNLNGFIPIKVASFSELLDVRDSLNRPILYLDKKSTATFVIINDKEVYVYETDAYTL